MRKFGLIGKTLVHSFSKKYFTEKFEREAVDANYELYSIANVDSLRQFVQEHSLCGLNVTIPYKQDVIPLLDEIDSEARESLEFITCRDASDVLSAALVQKSENNQ